MTARLLIHPTRTRSWRPEVQARVDAWVREREGRAVARVLPEPRSSTSGFDAERIGPSPQYPTRESCPSLAFPSWFWPVVAPLLLWAGWEVTR